MGSECFWQNFRVSSAPRSSDGGSIDLARLRQKLSKEIGGEEFYRGIERNGVELRGPFASVDRLWLGDGEALGRVKMSNAAADLAADAIQVMLLDGALQVVLAASNAIGHSVVASAAGYVMTGVKSCEIFAALPAEMWSHARLDAAATRSGEAMAGNVEIFDRAGKRIARLIGVRVQRSAGRKRPDWFYEVAWRESSLAGDFGASEGSAFAVSPQEIARNAGAAQSGSASSIAVAGTRGLLCDVDEIAAQFVGKALGSLGFDFAPGREIDEQQEASRLGIVPRHRRLFGRLLEMLAADGVLDRASSRWVVRRAPNSEDATAACEKIAAKHPEIRTELMLLGRCGKNLADVLRGEIDPLKLLFPQDASATAADLY